MVTLASVPVLVNVHAKINDHETITVELHETSETRHLVAYESEHIRDTLMSLSEGVHAPAEVVRAGSHSNVWKAVALHGRQTLPADQSVCTANWVVHDPVSRPPFVPASSAYRTGLTGDKPSVLYPSPMSRIAMSFVAEVEVRFHDHDSFGHVNNAVHATYCEQARVRFFEEVLGTSLSDPHIVVAHLELDYRAPIEGVGTVEMEVEAGESGGKSFPIYYTLSYKGEVVATGETVQVAMGDEGRPTRVPDQWREAIADQP